MSIPWTAASEGFDELWDPSVGGNSEGNLVPDALSTMFVKQEEHMEAYGSISHTTPTVTAKAHGQLDNPIIQAKIREYAGYTIEELMEAINHLKNKPWKQSFKEVDRDAFLEEIADAWHFWIEMHLYAGITPEEVFKTYFKKSLVNEARRAEGY